MDMEESKLGLRRALDKYQNSQAAIGQSSSDHEYSGYDQMLESLESMEQTIMQHIRTSGLKKNRECCIIEEILNLRRRRRQIFAGIIKDISSLQESSVTVESALAHERESSTSRISKVESDLKAEVSAQSAELRRLKERHRAQLEEIKGDQRSAIAGEVARVKAKYEGKLRLLEERVGAVQSANAEQREEEARRAAAVREADLREEHSKVLLRYKEALRAVVDREKQLEGEKDALKRRLRACQQEHSEITDKLSTVGGQFASLQQASDQTRRLLEASAEKYARLAERMRLDRELHDSEIAAARATREDSLREAQAQHTAELSRVDEKVRQALAAKDEVIQGLQRELEEAQRRSLEAEELLESLNSDISRR
ncbi:unnamed protein product [Symbiodinium microadriaticum]|nr:unnamed protein product [Symbiodinium microadriaticum]